MQRNAQPGLGLARLGLAEVLGRLHVDLLPEKPGL